MKNISDSVKQVMVVFLFCFVALISYIAYFQVFSAPDIAAMQSNQRLWAKRNEVLRGTIYDRNGTALTTSKRVDALTQKRTYTQGDLYAHALGYVDPRYGLTGLEAKYDTELTTYSKLTNNFRNLINDFSMDKLKSMFETRKEDEIQVGNGVITTLDPAIQKAAYDALGSNKGAVVALNPKTGEVLAMVSKPTYNPNDLENEITAANAQATNDSPSQLYNRATAGLYPPGSTFKTITLSSALENMPGVTTRIFEDDGKIIFNENQSLSNDNNAVNGSIDLKDAFRVSSNVVFGTLAMELGNDKLKGTAEAYGFNNSIETNGFTLENSRFPTLKSSEKGNIAQTGIGQSSILATPMQMALVSSTIANNGKMMEPTLVSKVIDKDGNTVKTIDPKVLKQVISASNAATIKDYMKNLVDSKVNGKWNYFSGTNAAGKTGTADYNLPNGTPAKPHSWFIGFAPADNPQVAVAVIVENGGYGSTAAAQVAGNVIRTAVLR